MDKIDELLVQISCKDWGGRSLMQEARLSRGVFQYHVVMLEFPWAKELSFRVSTTTYTLRIARKTPQGGTWVPIQTAELTPKLSPDHTTKIVEILTVILGDKQALP